MNPFTYSVVFAFICNLFCLSSGNNLIFNAVHLSQAVYCENDLIDAWDCATCDKDAKLLSILENNGEKALVGVYPDTRRLFVSFRGSTNMQNWIDNVQFSLSCPYKDETICVETGFYKVFESMLPDVEKAIANTVTQYDINTILFTGHSLGASVATLMAYHFNNNNPYTTELITFGSPRVGNTDFVDDFVMNSDRYSNRITHAYDIVPHVPQNFLGYYHIPNELWYNEDNTEYSDCDDIYSSEEDPECSNSCGPIHCTSVSDHLNYLNITMGTDGDC